MAKNISTIVINANKAAVWNALTQPVLVKQWQYGSDLLTSWEVDSEIKYSTEWQGKTFEQWGKIREFKPTELIRYTLFAPRPGLEDKPENYFIMSYILSDEGEQTRLEIVQEDNRPNAVQESPQGDENPVLQALKKVAEAL